MNSDERDRREDTASLLREPPAGRAPAEPTASPTYRRRDVLRTVGGVAVVGLVAGCSGVGGEGGGGTTGGGGEPSVDEWLADTGNYDGVVDRTDASSVTVEVGAQGNNGANAFAPAAIEISPGTTVTWEWVDGYHNVVATEGAFDSGQPEQNATFQHTFDSPDTYLYYCEPHRSIGMKGAVVVSGGDSGSPETTTNGSEPR